MIYCPHCRKPSSRNTGPCPHCGKELAPAPAPGPVTERADAVDLVPSDPGELDLTPGKSSPQEEADLPQIVEDGPVPARSEGLHGSGEETIDFGDDGAVLEVASLPPPPQVTDTARLDEMEATDREIDSLAAFGRPKDGPAGNALYAIRVWMRRRELLELHREADARVEAATQKLKKSYADLGQAAARSGFEDDRHLAPFLANVKLAETRRNEIQGQRSDMESENRGRLSGLETEAKAIEEALAPVRTDESAALEALKILRTDQKRTEARLKRAEIELRNIEQILVQSRAKLQSPSLPVAEKTRLQSQMDEQEERKPALEEEIRGQRSELERFEKPVAEAESRLAQVRQHIAENMGQVSLKRQEASSLAVSLSKELGSFEEQLRQAEGSVEETWAGVGEKFYKLNYAVPDLEDMRVFILRAGAESRQARKRADLIEQAMKRYDRDAYAKGRNIVAGLLAALVFLAAFGLYVLFFR